jgi:hypothetical protein
VSVRLMSIESGTSAQTVAKMLRVLFPDAATALDMTYGSGKFWTGYDAVRVTGIDLDPTRALDVCADFTRLPFRDSVFDVAIFDPPYLSGCSKQQTARMGSRFSFFANDDDLRHAVTRGVSEAWRVSRVGVIVKVQNYSHSGRSMRMTRWVEDTIPEEAYGEVHALSMSKMSGATWGQQLSVYSVHTTYLAFRHGSQMHVRRGPPEHRAPERRAAQQVGLFDVAG